MAIDYNAGKTNQGPSNSTGMIQTPGTQLAGMQNVGASPNINPNMPAAPQIQKQMKSGYQQGLMKQQAPRPAAPVQRPQQRQQFVPTPTVTRTQMDQGRGYNIFSGMDANQINNMNQSMGLSNMTSLPSLVPPQESGAGFGLAPPGRPMSTQLMSGTGGGYNYGVPGAGGSVSVDPNTGEITSTAFGVTTSGGNIEDYKGNSNLPEGVQAYLESEKQKYLDSKQQEDVQVDENGQPLPTEEEIYTSAWYDDILGNQQGYDQEKKQAAISQYEENYNQAKATLDEKTAFGLQNALAGIDRQMAMMGTFGSGAHMMNMNNAMAQVLASMADQYAQIEANYADNIFALEKADLQQVETDIALKFGQKLQIADRLKEIGGMTDFVEKTNLTNGLVADVSNEVAAFGEAVGLGEWATNILKPLENYFQDLFMSAETPEQIQAIKQQFDEEIVGLFTIMKYYNQNNNKGGALEGQMQWNPETGSYVSAKSYYQSKVNDMIKEWFGSLGADLEYSYDQYGITL